MKIHILRIFLFLMSVLFSQALAQESLEAPEKRMMDVLDARYKAATVEMDYVLDSLLAQLDKPNQQTLRTAQDEWEKYRDRECTFYAKYLGGEIGQELLYQDCVNDITEERIEVLDYYTHQETVGKTVEAYTNIMHREPPPSSALK